MNFADILCPTCALFLDFDGTLVDIAPRPDAVVVPPGLVATLAAAQRYLGGAVAVISGRPIAQIDAFLAPLVLPAAGVHGAERRAPDGEIIYLPIHPLQLVEDAAGALALENEGLQTEIKRGSIALHYRNAPELQAQCIAVMQAAVDLSPGLTLLRGKMVVEAKSAGASKDKAIEAFMREAPFKGRTPLFVGDDVTDEVGFAMVQSLGGLGVKVGDGATVAWQRMPSAEAMRIQLDNAMGQQARKAAA
jgi:trehalose 6-phosphate phosphatase